MKFQVNYFNHNKKGESCQHPIFEIVVVWSCGRVVWSTRRRDHTTVIRQNSTPVLGAGVGVEGIVLG